MSTLVNEKIVMQFYLDCIDADKIAFLSGRDEMKAAIRANIVELMQADTMNSKIQIAIGLWKKLFEASMSFISPDKRGYDKIFKYFDSYVEFEELIFASDSFYRDHTLHCIWVYFLGEYVARKNEFEPLFYDMKMTYLMVDIIDAFGISPMRASALKKMFKEGLRMSDATRCVSALTHDLGYPLKKISKINKSISKVLPYFAVNDYTDFRFDFGSVQQEFIDSFVDFISRSLNANFAPKRAVRESKDAERILNRVSQIFDSVVKQEILEDGSTRTLSVDYDAIAAISEEDKQMLRDSVELETELALSTASKNAFLNDFENYQHGIMSAFLLVKNLAAFQLVDYDRQANNFGTALSGNELTIARLASINTILAGISAHTSEMVRISAIGEDNFLTFIDELEEFSRISRAGQNREHVKEFCESMIDMTEDGWLDIKFIFSNSNLDNLDPEISFKSRCKRFLTLFNIEHLSENLKIRVTCVGELPNNHNTYELEIARSHVDIRINGESQNIPKYLKSAQFYTKEEYAQMR